MSSINGNFIDGLFITLLFGNVLLVAMLSPFIDSGFNESDLPVQQQANTLANFSFRNIGLNAQSAVAIFVMIGFGLNIIVGSILSLFSFFGIIISIYGTLGLFGQILLSLNAIVGAFFLFQHVETIVNTVSSIVRAIGSLIPFT